MSTAVFSNRFTIQINDAVRLTFMDQRTGNDETVAEVAMTVPTARQLRDLLVQYVKDEETPQ